MTRPARMPSLFRSAVLLAGCCIATAFAQAPLEAIPETSPEMEAMLAKRLPRGTSMEDAYAWLRSQQFACSGVGRDEVFGGRAKAGTYLLCERESAYGFQVGKRWQVAVVRDGQDRVARVLGHFLLYGR